MRDLAPRPATAQRERLVSLRPFALLLVVAVVSLAVPIDRPALDELLAAFGGLLSLVVVQLLVSSRRSPQWLDPVPALGCFVVIALFRDATGGSSSGLSALVVAPAFYLAITGGKRQLGLATILTGLTFALPIVLLGAPDYTAQDWRRALIWTAVVGAFGAVLQDLVRSLLTEGAQARRSQDQLQLVMDSAELSSLIVTDPRGVITTFGVGAERLLDRSAADVVGTANFADLHDLDELITSAHGLGVRSGFAVFAELARSRSESRIWTWRRRDGAEIFVRSAITELRDGDALVGYLVVSIDATDAIRSRHALRDAEQRWRIVMDHLPDTTLIVIDRHFDTTLISGAGSMREKLGDRAGRPLAEVVSPDNVGVLTEMTTNALAGRPGLIDLNSARTGHEHEIAVVPLPYDDGSSDVLILARDVSRDRARERALVQAKQRAERMFADAPVAILLHDTAGLILSANPAALELFEIAREDLVGSDLARLSGPDAHDAGQYLASLRSGSGAAQARWRLETTGGRETFLSLTGRPLHDDPDHPDLVLTHVVDRTEQHRYEEQLLHLADHDPLTGLANRRRFSTELGRHLDTCRRYGAEGALLLLDLDHFKQVNDTLGHAVGDQLLVAVAELMTQDLRASDTVARLGGDEFAVLLPRVSRDDVEVVASSLVRTVRRSMQRHEGPAGEVTVSMGVALVEDSDRTAEDLMSIADLTLYQAKARGRDQHAVYDPHRATAPPSLVGLDGGLVARPSTLGESERQAGSR